MRKILFILLGCLVAFSAIAEDDIYEQKAAQIYDMCNKKIPQVNENGVLSGNIADVNRDRQLRQCLKSEIIKIADTVIQKDELEKFNNALDNLEKDSFAIYKTIIFCDQSSDAAWCRQYYKDDISLDILILEKRITSQIMKILTDLLEIKQDGFTQ